MNPSQLQNAIDAAWPKFVAGLSTARKGENDDKPYDALKELLVTESLAKTAEWVEQRGSWPAPIDGKRKYEPAPARGLTELINEERFDADQLEHGKGVGTDHKSIEVLLESLCADAIRQAITFVIQCLTEGKSAKNIPDGTPGELVRAARSAMGIPSAALSVIVPSGTSDEITADLTKHLRGGKVVEAPGVEEVYVVAHKPDGSVWRQAREFDLTWVEDGSSATLRIVSRLDLELVNHKYVRAVVPTRPDPSPKGEDASKAKVAAPVEASGGTSPR